MGTNCLSSGKTVLTAMAVGVSSEKKIPDPAWAPGVPEAKSTRLADGRGQKAAHSPKGQGSSSQSVEKGRR